MLQNWDSDLANAAQEWAQRCAFVHGNPGWAVSRYQNQGQIGQNLYVTTDPRSTIRDVVANWYNEKSNYRMPSENYYNENQYCTTGTQCGHYTQVRAYVCVHLVHNVVTIHMRGQVCSKMGCGNIADTLPGYWKPSSNAVTTFVQFIFFYIQFNFLKLF